jgi:hypothetical protein
MPLARLEPSDVTARQISRESLPAAAPESGRDGGVMHAQSRLWLDYDVGSLTGPVIGVSAFRCLL